MTRPGATFLSQHLTACLECEDELATAWCEVSPVSVPSFSNRYSASVLHFHVFESCRLHGFSGVVLLYLVLT